MIREEMVHPLDLFFNLFEELAVALREGVDPIRLLNIVGVIQLVFFFYLLDRLFIDNFKVPFMFSIHL
jgi:hypothetical protein